MDYTCSSE